MRTVVTVPALLAAICGNRVLRADSELFTREQVQPSQDHHRHLCVKQGRDHRSICAFMAGRLRPGHSYAAVVKDRRPRQLFDNARNRLTGSNPAQMPS